MVRKPGESADRYRQALRCAERACQLGTGHYRTKGVAQYRLGLDEEALKTFSRSDNPTNLTFRAMAQFRLGRKEDAQATLDRLREFMKDPEWQRWNLYGQLHRYEQDEVQSFLQEAEELIEGRQPEPKE